MNASRKGFHGRLSAAANDAHRLAVQRGGMAKQVVIRIPRVKITALALVVSLVGGTVGMQVVASHLSSEIGKADRSAPVLVTPSTGLRATYGVS